MSAIISPKVLAYFFSRNLVTSEEFSVVVLMLFGAVTGKERGSGSTYWFVCGFAWAHCGTYRRGLAPCAISGEKWHVLFLI